MSLSSHVVYAVPQRPSALSEVPRYFAVKKAGSSKQSARSGSKCTDRRTGKPYTVLLYGKMRELALYRAEVLAMRGFDVIIPRNNAEAVQAILGGGFQVAVLSYTLANGTVKEMSDLIRQQCPGCPLLVISQTAEDDPHVEPDAIVQAELGPAALVDTIHRTLQRRLQ
jgi:hypothetical protein